MGIVLPFDQKLRSKQKPAMPSAGARVMLFTGVRYERWQPAVAQKRTGPEKPVRKQV